MKTLILALMMLGAAVRGHAYGAALTPGVYRVDAGSYLTAAQRVEAGTSERIEERFEHALPAAAGVTHAVVSREARYGESERNRVLFLTVDGYQTGRGNDNWMCVTYALPVRRRYSAGDILFLENAVPVFASREGTNNRSELKAGTFVAVLDRQSEWFEVDYFEHGNARHGWIDRDDVVPVQWLAQRAATRDFRFRVGVVPGDSGTDAPQPVAIEVLSRHSGQRLQVLRDFESDGRYVLGEEAIDVVDANFDGHPDIAIHGVSGGAGPNSMTNVFLYDPVRRRFSFSRELSELTQLWIDPKTKTVHSAQRGSCCSHYSEVYRYVRGKLTLVFSKDEYDNGEWVSTWTGRLRKGKMYYRETRRRSAGN